MVIVVVVAHQQQSIAVALLILVSASCATRPAVTTSTVPISERLPPLSEASFVPRRCAFPANNSPRHFLVVHAGTRVPDDDLIRRIQRKYVHAMMGNGISSSGIGPCCLGEPDSQMCLFINVKAESPEFSSLPRKLDEALRAEGASDVALAVVVDTTIVWFQLVETEQASQGATKPSTSSATR